MLLCINIYNNNNRIKISNMFLSYYMFGYTVAVNSVSFSDHLSRHSNIIFYFTSILTQFYTFLTTICFYIEYVDRYTIYSYFGETMKNNKYAGW